MSLTLQLNNLSVATVKETIEPPKGVLSWLGQACGSTKNWNDIAKLSRDFFEWAGEIAKYQENTSLAEWTESPIKIFKQASNGTLIPFFLGGAAMLVSLKRRDGYIGVARKVLLFALSGTLFGAVTLGIGSLSQPLTIVLFAWYTFDLGVQMRSLMIVRTLKNSYRDITTEATPGPTCPPVIFPLRELIDEQNKIAMIQVAKAVASWVGAVFGELCPAYAVTNATLSLGSSLLGIYVLHARDTSPYQLKIL